MCNHKKAEGARETPAKVYEGQKAERKERVRFLCTSRLDDERHEDVV